MQINKPALVWHGELIPMAPDAVENIVIHHIGKSKASVYDVHGWHLDNGWVGIGYNEYIRKDGSVDIVRGDNQGAHCYGFNHNSYGIACEGDYDVETAMPTLQYLSLVERIKLHRARFKNLKKVDGHKAFLNTACPGKYFPLEKIKLSVITNMPVLKIGSSGEPVKYLQIQLNRKGSYGLLPDGAFGPATQRAVKDFQTKKNLVADGIVGTFTWAALM